MNFPRAIVCDVIDSDLIDSLSTPPSDEDRARLSPLGWSDGSLSTAPLRPDLLLPVPEPAALFVGL